MSAIISASRIDYPFQRIDLRWLIFNLLTMKKNKISFETRFWYAYEIENPFEVIDAFFDYADLEHYKQRLAEAVLYINKQEVYKKGYPGQVFVFYTTLRSFLKACF